MSTIRNLAQAFDLGFFYAFALKIGEPSLTPSPPAAVPLSAVVVHEARIPSSICTTRNGLKKKMPGSSSIKLPDIYFF